MEDKEKLRERLMARVQKSDGCWIWQGAKDKNGYGRIRVGNRKATGPHRLSWELHNGRPAGGGLVCHHCDTPACVNPDHLYLGTASDNNRDKMIRGRGVFHHGEKSGTSKLTEQAVRDIFALYASGGWRHVDLAGKFGVSPAAIQLILSGKNWQYLGNAPIQGMRHAPKRGLRKLSDESAAALVAEYRCGGISQNSLAKKYGVSQQYVSVAVKTG